MSIMSSHILPYILTVFRNIFEHNFSPYSDSEPRIKGELYGGNFHCLWHYCTRRCWNWAIIHLKRKYVKTPIKGKLAKTNVTVACYPDNIRPYAPCIT